MKKKDGLEVAYHPENILTIEHIVLMSMLALNAKLKG